jgi:hypothetical protein
MTPTSFAAGLCAAQASEDWHCPFAGFTSQSALPQRRPFVPSQSTNSIVVTCAPAEQPTSHNPSHRVNYFSSAAYADPPFESLRALRI